MSKSVFLTGTYLFHRQIYTWWIKQGQIMSLIQSTLNQAQAISSFRLALLDVQFFSILCLLSARNIKAAAVENCGWRHANVCTFQECNNCCNLPQVSNLQGRHKVSLSVLWAGEAPVNYSSAVNHRKQANEYTSYYRPPVSVTSEQMRCPVLFRKSRGMRR